MRGIAVLRGLPRTHCGGVVAHELCHAFMAMSQFPLLPVEVKRLLETEKQFTNSSDTDVVADLYRRFFETVTAAATSLTFRGLAWTDGEAEQLAQALPRFTALTMLDLSHNKLGSVGAIMEALQSGTGALTSLDVGSNRLDEEAALAIVRAVKQRDRMTSLGLASCKIGPTGATEIAEYVKVSGALTKLNLDGFELDISQLRGTEPVETQM